MKKQAKLNTTFYRNFLLLVVIPIFLVFVSALGIIRNLMMESAYATIEVTQRDVASSLSKDINDTSLKLTHFLLTNDKQALELAKNTVMSTGLKQYQYNTQLIDLYNFVVTPSSNIVGIHFYAKNGQTIELKNNLAIQLNELKKYDFYQNALDDREQTYYGLINASFTYSTNQQTLQKVLAVSFAPVNSPIEMVCWYINISANQLINSYSRDEKQGQMYLLDSQGNILIQPSSTKMDSSVLKNIRSLKAGRYAFNANTGRVNALVSDVPYTNWRIISVVKSSALLDRFNKIQFMVLLTSVIIFAMFFTFSKIFLHNIIKPIDLLANGMSDVEKGNLDVQIIPIGQYELRNLIRSFNSMIGRTKTLLQLTERQQQQKMEAEMAALQSQINPHFLVNALNSIRLTAMVSKFDNIKNMAEALIKILSTSFQNPNDTYSIRDEVDTLKSYIYLMQIRYTENFSVDWEINEETLDYSIPRLLIQPVVENAIVHGFENKEEPGKILISIQKQESAIFINVKDDGQGMDSAIAETILQGNKTVSKKGHGIGLANVNRRIKLNYGEKYGVTVQSTPGIGSIFTITIPAIRPQEENRNV